MEGMVVFTSLSVEILELSQIDVIIGVFEDFRNVLKLSFSKNSCKFSGKLFIFSSNVWSQEFRDCSRIKQTTIMIFENLKEYRNYFKLKTSTHMETFASIVVILIRLLSHLMKTIQHRLDHSDDFLHDKRSFISVQELQSEYSL